MDLPGEWKDFCERGRYSRSHQRKSVERCFDGSIVRGHYTDLRMDPTLDPSHPMYPSHDHTTQPKDDREMVIDARVLNDAKTLLSEDELWRLIEHLYAVGLAKGRIPARSPQRVSDDWRPSRGY